MAEWQDAPELVDSLVKALRSFDWTEAERQCDTLIERLNRSEELFPERAAKTVLQELRRKRQVRLMALVADGLIASGRSEPTIQRQYAQALIEQGNLASAERVLLAISSDPATSSGELAEARGLLGRVYKQRYVDAQQPQNPRQQKNLQQAVRWYYDVYVSNPAVRWWHGINAAALLARAERDGVPLNDPSLPDFSQLPKQILSAFRAVEEEVGELDLWQRATSMEAHVALNQFDEAQQDLAQYMYDGNADAFECNSTLRQLREVWQIDREGGPGARITAGLQAALLKRSGGEVELQSRDVNQGLQLNFSASKDLTYQWWDQGLKRCATVARIEDASGRRVGTGFLVHRGDFLPGSGRAPALLTNWHVISDKGEHPLSIRPEAARANFEACGKTFRIAREMLAYSRVLDASLVALEEFEGVDGHCPIEPAPADFSASKQPRVYVIGYPGGRGLSFSVHDSVWLDSDATRLHYRTPTEPGSSGSPVFDQDHWTLIGLHHAGKTNMAKLNGKTGTYEANEGFRVNAIQAAIKANPKS